jgi:tRNA nucleotidyltransferase (CCA-adding enzyme)
MAIAGRLNRHGHGAWIVGGCVRDLLRGVPVADWDIATSAPPREVQRLFRRTIPTGIAHGTITVLEAGEAYEVTTLRGEGAYSDGRRPDQVVFVSGIEEDLGRRDFTVNAIAFDPVSGRAIDPWGGAEDLDARRLRAVRDPMERFAEDGLRVLRAARFVATLEMELDPETEAAIRPNLEVFGRVSRERVLAEWEKACNKARQPSRAFAVMRRTGMLGVVAAPLDGLPAPRFEEGLRRMDAAPAGLVPRLAALCLEVDPEHDRKALSRMLSELRASTKDREAIVHLVRTFERGPLDGVTDGPLPFRQFLRRVGRAELGRAFDLRRADAAATGRPDDVTALEARARAELAAGLPLAIADLAVTGHDLMTELGVPPGRGLGVLLGRLVEHCLARPEDNRREALLGVARTLLPAT